MSDCHSRSTNDTTVRTGKTVAANLRSRDHYDTANSAGSAGLKLGSEHHVDPIFDTVRHNQFDWGLSYRTPSVGSFLHKLGSDDTHGAHNCRA